MATISTHLRTFKEPTREQLTQIFFSIPSLTWLYGGQPPADDLEKLEISAVLSLAGGEEDSYVSANRCRLEDAQPERVQIGRETASYPAFSRVCIPRPQICPLHDPVVDDQTGRASERSCGHLCPESSHVARLKNRASSAVTWASVSSARRMDAKTSVHPCVGCAADVVATDSRSVLRAVAGCAQGGASTRPDESCKRFCQDVLFRNPRSVLFYCCRQRAGGR